MTILDFQPGSFVFNVDKNDILEVIAIKEDRTGAICYNHSRRRSVFISDKKKYVPLDKYRSKKIGKSIKPRHRKQFSLFDETPDFFPEVAANYIINNLQKTN